MNHPVAGIGISIRRHVLIVAQIAMAGVLALSVIAIPAIAAFAAPPTPNQAVGVQNQTERLERLFRRELKALEYMQKRLNRANELVTKAQQRIDNLKAKGKDTSKLEAGLADFRAALATAQSELNTAKSILDARAGFDAEGKVVDANKAKETVREAGKAERKFLQTMRKAIHQLSIDIRQLRQANRVR